MTILDRFSSISVESADEWRSTDTTAFVQFNRSLVKMSYQRIEAYRDSGAIRIVFYLLWEFLLVVWLFPALMKAQAVSQIAATMPRPSFTISQETKKVSKTPSNASVWAMYAAVVASNIIDIETAQSCVRSHLCREANPLVRNRAVGYSIGLSFATLSVLVARHAHREHKRVWVLPFVVGLSAHGAGIASNEVAGRRRR